MLREILEVIVPLLPLLSGLAALGVVKRGPIPVEVSAAVVLALVSLVCALMVLVIVRVLLGGDAPRISIFGATALVCGTVFAPAVLWFRNDRAFSPLIELAVGANAACLMLGVILSVLSWRIARESEDDASVTATRVQDAGPVVHSTPRVRVRRRRGAAPVVVQLPRMLGIAFFVVIAVVFALLWTNWVVDSAEPARPGIFVEESCTPARYGCTSIGTWTSDDGSLRLDEVEFDGVVEPDGTAQAWYRPEERDPRDAIVHSEFSMSLAPMVFPACVIGSFYAAYHFGDSWWGWSRWARRRRASRTLDTTPDDVRGAAR